MQLTDSLTFFCQFVYLWREERREGDEGDAEDDDEGGHHADHNGGATTTLRLLFGGIGGGSGVAARTERYACQVIVFSLERFSKWTGFSVWVTG